MRRPRTANVLFFVIVQTVFFWLVASQEVDRVVKKKAQILRLLRDNLKEQGLDDAVLALDVSIVRTTRENTPKAEAAAARRRGHNLRLTVRVIGAFMAAVLLCLILVVVYNRHAGHRFGSAHWFGMALVPFVYVFELLFFLLVVEQYTMIGDYDLARQITGLR